ncbi:glycoside hydrolase [Lineolata rhizophorae]|uniref:lytic cellulose monooxygenase (C4-dehydrogenating) n=1 Tax=Lineolata rhizophorae TaxID=578093 RepID=A0A6A6NQB4_9PEZI|nr:glycoside hydrolase [Lineolata rhizophorae]
MWATGLFLLGAAAAVNAHYTFPALIANNTVTGEWEYVRMTANHYSNGPVTDVTSQAIRCYEDPSHPSTETFTVEAGSEIGFTAKSEISHPGTLQMYMAKVPEGETAATWDGSGDVWFKIMSEGPVISGGSLSWPSEHATRVSTVMPDSVPSGEYLFRVEHIALHSASSAGGAQFYISCAQLNVINGGSGSPGPAVALPGAYSPTDPGIMLNIYYPVPTSYEAPGPAVWTG